ncbi:hypothetical protein BKA69DRAFT_1127755 [Paraphysoderma sedebokerense]|nr:hypothetical protein BKA69DRAFT_1127755 [Paraphysoderma sedebokerense]
MTLPDKNTSNSSSSPNHNSPKLSDQCKFYHSKFSVYLSSSPTSSSPDSLNSSSVKPSTEESSKLEPKDQKENNEICFCVNRLFNLSPSKEGQILQNKTWCVRRDESVLRNRQNKWNLLEGYYLRRSTSIVQLSSDFGQNNNVTPSALKEESTDVSIGEELIKAGTHTTNVVKKTFTPPIQMFSRYFQGFIDGSHARAIQRYSEAVVEVKAAEVAKKMVDVWAHKMEDEEEEAAGKSEKS